MHFKVRVFFEPFYWNKHASGTQRFSFFGTTIPSLRPSGHNNGLDLLFRGAATQRFSQVDPILCVETQIP
jgi:hypothetical protein